MVSPGQAIQVAGAANFRDEEAPFKAANRRQTLLCEQGRRRRPLIA
jgi:hypothetical protein